MAQQQMPQALENEYKEAFSFYDPQASGKIDAVKLVSLMRSLGQNVTENDVASMCTAGTADVNALLSFFRQKWQAMVASEDLLEAFAFFDPQRTGSVSKMELSRHLTQHGEPLSQAEVDDMLGGGQSLQYQAFVDAALKKGN